MKKLRAGLEKAAQSLSSYLLAIAVVAAGLLLTVWPNLSKYALAVCTGLVLAVYGLVQLILYFSRDVETGIVRGTLMRGFLFIGLGVWIMVSPTLLMNAITYLLGVVLLIGSAYKLQVAFDVWRMHNKYWYLFLVAGAAMLALGVLVLVRPAFLQNALMLIIGISLILEGVLDGLAVAGLTRVRKAFVTDTVPLSTVLAESEPEQAAKTMQSDAPTETAVRPAAQEPCAPADAEKAEE